MKRVAFVGIGAVVGFVVALTLFPAAQGANDMSAYKQLDLFSDAFERVRDDYVRPVDDSELIDNAIDGMVSALDPHSGYMNAKAFADMQIQTKGEFGGLGIEVTAEDGLIKVISPIDDTPAARAGIKAGDYIAAIDGMSVQGMTLTDAIDKMRGAQGTKVTITILRPGQKKPFNVAITRAVVEVKSVKYHREGDIGYIRIATFSEKTNDELDRAISDLQRQIGPGLKGYILDLRNDPGGLLDQAIDVSDDFIDSGEIVSTRGRHPDDTERYDAKSGDVTGGKPIIVLVNGGTASAAEIVAGALQDHKRATILGMTSFGKGSVQTIITLGAGRGALRLTTARYYTPSGHSIQAQGIAPDVMVAQGDESNLTQFQQTSEANLPGHLAPEEVARRAKQQIIHPPAGKKFDDFQLSYALDLMRGKVTTVSANKSANAD